MDIVDAKTRSRMMSGIRSKNTKPEIMVRKALHARGFRYRLHVVGLPGKPDIVFPKYKAACFVHGCFWHQHRGCRYAATPQTRPEFWARKFQENVDRDHMNEELLVEMGWRVYVVWECEVKNNLDGVLQRLEVWLSSPPAA